MAYEAFSAEWARAYKERINANPNYREAARAWEWPLVLVLEADPSVGIEKSRAILLDLYRGECRDARVATEDDLANAPYVVSASASTWKRVMDGQLDPLTAVMRGELKIVKGSVGVLSGYVTAARELVHSARRVDTEFPSGLG